MLPLMRTIVAVTCVVLGCSTGSGEAPESIGAIAPAGADAVAGKVPVSTGCIAVLPKEVAFAPIALGDMSVQVITIRNCGETMLSVTGTDWEGTPPEGIRLMAASVEAPWTIAPDGMLARTVVFRPVTEGEVVGVLRIRSDSTTPEVLVDVGGSTLLGELPTYGVVVAEGAVVKPQTVLHLTPDPTVFPVADIASWQWTVEQPVGSVEHFSPSDFAAATTFTCNVAGKYTFSLKAWDKAGKPTYGPASALVMVLPDETLHVELLWHTPNDPDESDEGPEAGSDVDLHFVHDAFAVSGPDLDLDGAPDPWFDSTFDCFFKNMHPDWGAQDDAIADDPGLDRDDTDGAGPENMNLDLPESATYRIGVHYWSDHEYGPSWVTLRVYVYGTLTYEVKDLKLVNHDLWNVATVDWPSGTVTPVVKDGGYWITHAYQNPLFFQP